MNNNILNIHPELLDKKRQEVLRKLTPFISGFVLGGGTALALQLNHRQSYDFDFFSPSQIPKTLLEKLSKMVPVKNIVIDTSDELTFFTTSNIKITFLYYPFKPIFEHIKTEEGLWIFPVKEIALQKAYTIGRRGEYRDYFDLYTILKNGHSNLAEIMKGAKQIYDGAFDEKLFLEQLVYYGDLQRFEVTPASKKPLPTPDEIKHYFKVLVKTYVSL